MIRLSSSITLFLSIFIPVCWFTFMGATNILIWIIDAEDLPSFQKIGIRILLLSILVIFGLFLNFTLMKLRRVEMDKDALYITNFFKTIKLSFAQITEAKLTGNHLTTLTIDHKTIFGSKIYYISNPENFAILRHQLEK